MSTKTRTTDADLRDEHRELVSLGLKAIRQALVYQGDNAKYMDQGKLGAAAVMSYYKGVSALTNEAEVRLSYLRACGAAPHIALQEGQRQGLLTESIG